MTRWSFGVFGDILWDVVPELRQAIKDFISEQLQTCVNIDEPMEQPDVHDFSVHVVGPQILNAIEEGHADPDIVRKFAEVIRRAVLYEGSDILFHHHLDLFLLENMDTGLIVPAMFRADPDVVELVRQRFPGRWEMESFGDASA